MTIKVQKQGAGYVLHLLIELTNPTYIAAWTAFVTALLTVIKLT